eukprot:CAMPEP_0181439588 /NCGR_PEP_ID=MMETSP1110-20121109/22509_1 /TAXON_ID=174948 /ORGANISM="Symbiodinium sp., Strain CCMP421" /LENGTH=133 /DNA_ID=CAMNT_0023563325 /DNA_START=48 /DNA_END=447 /DNA_ORIENTATION=+
MKVQQKDEEGEFLQMMALQQNMRTLSHCRIFAGVMAGCIAGLLKIEGLLGVAIFVLVTLTHSLMICAKMGFEVTSTSPKAETSSSVSSEAACCPSSYFGLCPSTWCTSSDRRKLNHVHIPQKIPELARMQHWA